MAITVLATSFPNNKKKKEGNSLVQEFQVKCNNSYNIQYIYFFFYLALALEYQLYLSTTKHFLLPNYRNSFTFSIGLALSNYQLHFLFSMDGMHIQNLNIYF